MKIRIAFAIVAVLAAMPVLGQSIPASAPNAFATGTTEAPSIANSAGLVRSEATSGLPSTDTPPASELPKWQIRFGFKGERYEEFRGGPVGDAISDYDFWTYGPNFTVTRYLNTWLGLDADFTPGWGHTTAGSHLVTQSFDWGLGPRFALRGRRHLEPFVRTSFGSAHFHFDNSGALPATLNSFQYSVGAGSGFKLTRKLMWTLEVDYMGTHFFSNNQKDVEMRSEVVFSF